MKHGYSDWLTALRTLAEPAVLVSLIAARGSLPRDPGARMLVGRDWVHDTIGGGGLEWEAIHHARQMLMRAEHGARVRRYPLGLAFGQCCGGVAVLAFEPLAAAPAWLARLDTQQPAVRAYGANGATLAPFWLSVDSVEPDTTEPAQRSACSRARELLASGLQRPCIEHADGSVDTGVGDGPLHVFEPLQPQRLRLALFGAGHVGRALVQVLSGYPAVIEWWDARPEVLPNLLPSGVSTDSTTDLDALVEALVPDTLCAVLTHDHSLDLELVSRLLPRADLPLVGLIGSRSKRANFERRLRQRGLDAAQIERLACPLGTPGDKHPVAVAIAIAAELLRVHSTLTTPPASTTPGKRLWLR